MKIEKVISEYKVHGFDVNQDLPGNIHWQDLYKASPPGTKVILTVRDSGGFEVDLDTFHFRWLKIKRIYATLPILITLISHLLKWKSS